MIVANPLPKWLWLCLGYIRLTDLPTNIVPHTNYIIIGAIQTEVNADMYQFPDIVLSYQTGIEISYHWYSKM